MFFLVFFEDVFLFEFFEGVELVVFEMPYEDNFSIGTLADN